MLPGPLSDRILLFRIEKEERESIDWSIIEDASLFGNDAASSTLGGGDFLKSRGSAFSF